MQTYGHTRTLFLILYAQIIVYALYYILPTLDTNNIQEFNKFFLTLVHIAGVGEVRQQNKLGLQSHQGEDCLKSMES